MEVKEEYAKDLLDSNKVSEADFASSGVSNFFLAIWGEWRVLSLPSPTLSRTSAFPFALFPKARKVTAGDSLHHIEKSVTG